MRELGYTWAWETGADGDVLRMTTPALPAVVQASGKLVFFNQAIAQALGNAQSFSAVGGGAGASAGAASLREYLTFGDGSDVDEAALRFAAEVADACAYDVEWQRGDIALIDKCGQRAAAAHGARMRDEAHPSPMRPASPFPSRSYLVMHARRPWVGEGPRKVLASLINEPSAPLPVVGAVVNAHL